MLGVSPLARAQVIRQAYRERILVAHPDRLAGGAGAAASYTGADELNAAWEVLGDEQRRAVYDEQRRRSKGEPSELSWHPCRIDG